MERPVMASRMDSRDDMASFVAAALNPGALRCDPFSNVTAIIDAAAPQLSPQVQIHCHDGQIETFVLDVLRTFRCHVPMLALQCSVFLNGDA